MQSRWKGAAGAGAEVQRCRAVQRCKAVQMYRCADVQRCRDVEVQRCKGVEAQRFAEICRDAEVVQGCGGAEICRFPDGQR